MAEPETDWIFLIYTLPSQPTRLRLQAWRSLQKMGALYLHNAAWVLPALPELVENMEYVATTIQENGGACQLVIGKSRFPAGEEQIIAEFRALADERMNDIRRQLAGIEANIEKAASLTALEESEEELKRERMTYLRSQRLTYFGSEKEAEVDHLLEHLRRTLDDHYRLLK